MQAKQPTAKHSHEVEVKRRVQIWVPVLKGNEKMAAAVAQVRLHLQVNMNSERNGRVWQLLVFAAKLSPAGPVKDQTARTGLLHAVPTVND